MEAATKKGPTIVLEDRCYSKFVTISTTQDISYIFIKKYIYIYICCHLFLGQLLPLPPIKKKK